MRLHCPQCGYAMHRLADACCCECGEAISAGALIQRVKGMRLSRRELLLRLSMPAMAAFLMCSPALVMLAVAAPDKVVTGLMGLAVVVSAVVVPVIAAGNAMELTGRLTFLLPVVRGYPQPTIGKTALYIVGLMLVELLLAIIVLQVARWVVM